MSSLKLYAKIYIEIRSNKKIDSHKITKIRNISRNFKIKQYNRIMNIRSRLSF